MKKKVVVVGPLLNSSGYGSHSRSVLRSLKNHSDADLYCVCTDWGNNGWISDSSDEKKFIDETLMKTQTFVQAGGQFDVSIQVDIPLGWKKVAKKNIGVTAAIETTFAMPQWIDACNQMDKIVVVSDHAKRTLVDPKYQVQDKRTGQGFLLQCNVPVDVCGYESRPLKEKKDSGLLSDVKTDFNFLMMNQWGPRKNLENAVSWFLHEFKNDENVGLILKIHRMNQSVGDREFCFKEIQRMKKFIGSKAKVYLLHGQLSEDQVQDLFSDPKVKAFVNIAHGEGFCIPMFDAVCQNVPVISLNYGGPIDFLFYEDKSGKRKSGFTEVPFELRNVQPEAVQEGIISPDMQWAFADEKGYRLALKSMVEKDYGLFKSQSKKLGEFVRKKFEKEEEKFAGLSVGIDDLAKKLKNVKIEDLPKISLITSVFNGDEFIDGFLEDIENQTIFKEKCELILVNANSPGNEEEKILAFKEKYPNNVKYIKLDSDPGIYACWNLAIKESSGEYISNANLDDRKRRDSLEQHAKFLFISDQADLVYSDSYISHESNYTFNKLEKINISEMPRYSFDEFSPKALLKVNLPHHNPMWKKRLHEQYGYFNEEFSSASDWQFWLKCATSGSIFKKINEILGIYYFNPNGISTSFKNFKKKQKEEASVYNEYSKLIQ